MASTSGAAFSFGGACAGAQAALTMKAEQLCPHLNTQEGVEVAYAYWISEKASPAEAAKKTKTGQ